MIFYAISIMHNAQNQQQQQTVNVSRETIEALILEDFRKTSHIHDGYYCFAFESNGVDGPVYNLATDYNAWIFHDLGFDYDLVIIRCDNPIVDNFGNRVRCYKSFRSLAQSRYGVLNREDILLVHTIKIVQQCYRYIYGGQPVSDINFFH